jgi:D-serine dehydratase
VGKQYHKAKKALQTLVLPLLSNPETLSSSVTNQHFVIAKAILKANSSWTNKITESSPEIQQSLAEQKQKLIAEYPKLKRIASKIKQALTDINQVDNSAQNSE